MDHMNNVFLPDKRRWEVKTGYVVKDFSKRNIPERISGVTGVSWYKLSGSSHDFGVCVFAFSLRTFRNG